MESRESKRSRFSRGWNVTTRQTKVAAYRKAARDANNAHEALLNALTTDEEVAAFDPNWTKEFHAANPIDFWSSLGIINTLRKLGVFFYGSTF